MSKTCTIRVLDEVNCVVLGLDDYHTKYFYEKYAPFAENYFFTKKYQMGRWDGRYYFFSKGGRTYNNLLPDIIPQVNKWGYKIKFIDNRSPISIQMKHIDKDYFKSRNDIIELGDHQVKGVNAIYDNGGGIIRAGTGAGKSYMVAALAQSYVDTHNFKVIIIVPSTDLIEQAIVDFRENLNMDVGEYSGDVKDIDHPIIVSTWQALQNVPHLMGLFNVAIVDECHGAKGNVIKELLNEAGAHLNVRIGVTGTLPDNDLDWLSVRVTLGDPVFTITSKELIDLGWLAEVDIQLIELEEDFRTEFKEFKIAHPDKANKLTYAKFVETMFPDYTSEKTYLGKQQDRVEFITDMIRYKSQEKKGNTLVLVNSVSTGKKFQKLIEGSFFVYGEDKKAARRQIYNLFNTHDNIVVIATSQLASTGLNIPRIFNLFMVDSGKSYIRTIQSIGRGLRKAHDKFKVLVIDIYSNLNYSRKHKNQRVMHYKGAEYNHTIRKCSYRQRLS
jgi:superfamily II DNA or RNA helicase